VEPERENKSYKWPNGLRDEIDPGTMWSDDSSQSICMCPSVVGRIHGLESAQLHLADADCDIILRCATFWLPGTGDVFHDRALRVLVGKSNQRQPQ
jgi:hypothetical protein